MEPTQPAQANLMELLDLLDRRLHELAEAHSAPTLRAWGAIYREVMAGPVPPGVAPGTFPGTVLGVCLHQLGSTMQELADAPPGGVMGYGAVGSLDMSTTPPTSIGLPAWGAQDDSPCDPSQ